MLLFAIIIYANNIIWNLVVIAWTYTFRYERGHNVNITATFLILGKVVNRVCDSGCTLILLATYYTVLSGAELRTS